MFQSSQLFEKPEKLNSAGTALGLYLIFKFFPIVVNHTKVNQNGKPGSVLQNAINSFQVTSSQYLPKILKQ